LGDLFDHLDRIFVEYGVMLDDNQGMARFFQHGHELEHSECSTDIQVCELAVKFAEDAGIVTADLKHLVTL